MPIIATRPRVVHDWLKHETDPSIGRAEITLASGAGNLDTGTVLGKITIGALSATVDGSGNTGDGALTLDATTPLGASALAGDYVVECIGGTLAAAAAADGGNTGDGAISLGSPALIAGAREGVYIATCVDEAANGGEFVVEDPDGVTLGTAVVGAEFSNEVVFTIADGATDFVAGDRFEVTVSQSVDADAGTFTVTAPDGSQLANAVAGVAYAGVHVQFTIADGATDFVIGDAFTITVSQAAASGEWTICDLDATDGSQVPAGLLWDRRDASTAAVRCAAVIGFAEIVMSELVFHASFDTDAKKISAMAALAEKHLHARPVA